MECKKKLNLLKSLAPNDDDVIQAKRVEATLHRAMILTHAHKHKYNNYCCNKIFGRSDCFIFIRIFFRGVKYKHQKKENTNKRYYMFIKLVFGFSDANIVFKT